MLDRIKDMMSMALGAYSLTVLTGTPSMSARSWGFRPLSMGRLNGS